MNLGGLAVLGDVGAGVKVCDKRRKIPIYQLSSIPRHRACPVLVHAVLLLEGIGARGEKVMGHPVVQVREIGVEFFGYDDMEQADCEFGA